MNEKMEGSNGQGNEIADRIMRQVEMFLEEGIDKSFLHDCLLMVADKLITQSE